MEMEASIGLYLDNNRSYSITGVHESLYKFWNHHVYISNVTDLYDPLHSLKTEKIGIKKMTAKIAVVDIRSRVIQRNKKLFNCLISARYVT